MADDVDGRPTCDYAAPMGDADLWLKLVMAEETATLTRHAVSFVAEPTIRTTELRPDGLLSTTAPAALCDLPPPWSLLHHEAVFEGKMPGDKLGPDAFQRLCFRREARQAQRFRDAEKAKVELDPEPARCAAWMLAPHVARWLREWEQAGRLTLAPAGAGCWWVQPATFPFLWIAANELPLRDELIPFLSARSGKKLEEFVAWVIPRRPPAWLAELMYAQPEVAEMIESLDDKMSPEAVERAVTIFRKTRFGKRLTDEGVEKGIGKGRIEAFEHLYARRLGRSLVADERAELLRRLDTLGPDRIGDVVLDLERDALSAWLADPNAT